MVSLDVYFSEFILCNECKCRCTAYVRMSKRASVYTFLFPLNARN